MDNFASSPTARDSAASTSNRIEKGQCDVVYLDVIYMPEFASKGLLRDMSEYLDSREGAEIYDDRMMRTVAYEDKLWGVPKQLDGGVGSSTAATPRSVPRSGRTSWFGRSRSRVRNAACDYSSMRTRA